MKDGLPEVTTPETRRLAAIMFTDIVGFSRQMGSNEAHTLQLLTVHNQVIQQAVATHHGHVIKTVGDAFLIDFPSVSTPCSVPKAFTLSSVRTTQKKRKPSRF